MPAPQMTILADAVAMVAGSVPRLRAVGPVRWAPCGEPGAVGPGTVPAAGPGGSVREEVLVLEAGEVEAGSFREKAETGLCCRCPAFAGEHGIELGLERVQVEHVARGVVLLLICQFVRTPIGALLLLGEVDAEELAAQVLEAVAVGVGACQLGSDLGAVDGLCKHTQMLCQHGDIEAAEMKDLEHRAIHEQGFEPRCRPILTIELYEVGHIVAGGELDQAEPVAMRLKA